MKTTRRSKNIDKTKPGVRKPDYFELDLFRRAMFFRPENESLEQPSSFKETKTVTTYGAYQEPF